MTHKYIYRRTLERECEKRGIEFLKPSPIYCTDNAAMIGVAGSYEYLLGYRSDLTLNAVPNLSIGKREGVFREL